MSTSIFRVSPVQAPAPLTLLIAVHHASVRAGTFNCPAAALCAAEFLGFAQEMFSSLKKEEEENFFGAGLGWGTPELPEQRSIDGAKNTKSGSISAASNGKVSASNGASNDVEDEVNGESSRPFVLSVRVTLN